MFEFPSSKKKPSCYLNLLWVSAKLEGDVLVVNKDHIVEQRLVKTGQLEGDPSGSGRGTCQRRMGSGQRNPEGETGCESDSQGIRDLFYTSGLRKGGSIFRKVVEVHHAESLFH